MKFDLTAHNRIGFLAIRFNEGRSILGDRKELERLLKKENKEVKKLISELKKFELRGCKPKS